jgi:hypothetical protein
MNDRNVAMLNDLNTISQCVVRFRNALLEQKPTRICDISDLLETRIPKIIDGSPGAEPVRIPENDVCAICLEADQKKHGLTKTECGHVFHTSCLQTHDDHAKKKTKVLACPVCRQLRGFFSELVQVDFAGRSNNPIDPGSQMYVGSENTWTISVYNTPFQIMYTFEISIHYVYEESVECFLFLTFVSLTIKEEEICGLLDDSCFEFQMDHPRTNRNYDDFSIVEHMIVGDKEPHSCFDKMISMYRYGTM